MQRVLGSKFKKAVQGFLSLGLALFAFSWIGCGSGATTVPVSGKVTHEGQPVSGGSVTFVPIGAGATAGRPAVGAVQSDGTYVLGTDEKGDGAVVGQHRVMYSPPAGEHDQGEGEHDEDQASPESESPYSNLVPKDSQVEVQPGENQIDIELVPA
jgi:hypothetical protein